MISFHHKFIFVHIPKCGGQSVEGAALSDLGMTLRDHGRLFLCFARESAAQWPGRYFRLAHLTAREYRDHYLPPERFEQMYKFAVVRDPYAKVESHFRYNKYAQRMSFDAFVLKTLPKLAREDPFFASQMSYLTDADGTVLVDDVIRLEDLSARWPEIKARAGIETDLGHTNSTKDKGDALIWTPQMVAKLSEIYADDFAHLGYPERAGQPGSNPAPAQPMATLRQMRFGLRRTLNTWRRGPGT